MIFKHYPFCLEPLPDELSYSVILRTAEAMSDSVNKILSENNIGNGPGAGNAKIFSYQLSQYKDPEAVYPHSVLPWYFTKLTQTQQRLAINGRMWPKNDFKTSKFFRPPKLGPISFCPKCLMEDREKYGVGYFHAMHQMEGISVCPKHGTKLIFLEDKWPSLEEEDPIPKQGTDIERELALMAFQSLGTSIDDWLPLFQEKYKDYGIFDNSGQINRFKLLSIIETYYKGSVFESETRVLTGYDKWPIRLPVFSLKKPLIEPFQMILMAKALGIEPPKRELKMPEPFFCPRCGSPIMKRISGGIQPKELIKCLNCGKLISIENKAYANLPKPRDLTDSEMICQAAPVAFTMKQLGYKVNCNTVGYLLRRTIGTATPWTKFIIETDCLKNERKMIKRFLELAPEFPFQEIIKTLQENKGIADNFVSDLLTIQRLNENYLREKGIIDG